MLVSMFGVNFFGFFTRTDFSTLLLSVYVSILSCLVIFKCATKTKPHICYYSFHLGNEIS